MLFKQILDLITDFLFPPFCLCCKKSGEWWCGECRLSVQRLNSQICPKCLSVECRMSNDERNTSYDVGCTKECGNLPFSSVFAFGYYHDPSLRPVITALKFNGTKAVLVELEKFISSHPHAKEIAGLLASGVVVPMPLSDKRLRERGFNQAELIAKTIVDSTIQSVIPAQARIQVKIQNDLLVRTGHRVPQSSLEHDIAARKENIKGSFECVGYVPENIILIDDVATTGATAAEAARILLDAGAKNVHLVCLAVGA